MNFVDYVESFYGNVPDAIYPIGATREMIINAIEIYINSNNLQFPWGGGDSVDREHVRDIMIEKYNLVFPTNVSDKKITNQDLEGIFQ